MCVCCTARCGKGRSPARGGCRCRARRGARHGECEGKRQLVEKLAVGRREVERDRTRGIVGHDSAGEIAARLRGSASARAEDAEVIVRTRRLEPQHALEARRKSSGRTRGRPNSEPLDGSRTCRSCHHRSASAAIRRGRERAGLPGCPLRAGTRRARRSSSSASTRIRPSMRKPGRSNPEETHERTKGAAAMLLTGRTHGHVEVLPGKAQALRERCRPRPCRRPTFPFGDRSETASGPPGWPPRPHPDPQRSSLRPVPTSIVLVIVLERGSIRETVPSPRFVTHTAPAPTATA